ncbi:MAG: hypothetical protein ACOCV1_01700 [Bacillota bacterium]
MKIKNWFKKNWKWVLILIIVIALIFFFYNSEVSQTMINPGLSSSPGGGVSGSS